MLLEFDKWYHLEICLSCFSGLVILTVLGLSTNSSRMFFFSFMIAIRSQFFFLMSLCLSELFLLLRKAPVFCLYHVWMPMGKNRVSSLCPTGCCLEFSLLFFVPPLTHLCRRSSQVSILRQHHRWHWVFPSPWAWLKSSLETDSSSHCLWFNLKPQGPEAHGLDSVSFSS